MKSVGEVMAIGRTFGQAFAKALRSRELDKPPCLEESDGQELFASLAEPRPERFETILELLGRGTSVDAIQEATSIDPWFLRELYELARDPEAPFAGQRSFRSVDTCAAEFPARTPYYYSGWDGADNGVGVAGEVVRGDRESVVILGAGPNRIGQGIEFDYCCVHAAMTVRESGRDAVMVNCNPETVSTDYDTSDRLYFEPLTLQDVLAVVEAERSGGRLGGVIVQFGGQTPLKLAAGLAEAGVPLLGTSVEAIDLAEDRGRFGALLARLGYKAPPYATARSVEQALRCAGEVGFPLLVRPSYVLGGRAMEIVYSHEDLSDYLRREAGEDGESGEIYLDRFLEDSLEVDVDALCDGTDVWIGGIMQHVEEAGVHSGDSACVLPPHSLGEEMLDQIRGATRAIALEIGVVGLINVQYAIHAGELYVIEANPRASRTVPFVSKAVGVALAKLACRVMLGEPLAAMGLPQERQGLGYGDHISVKEAVLPFDRFENSNAVLGPEMRSTGEVMGVARDFPTAFAKAQAAAGVPLPSSGTVFITVTDEDKAGGVGIAQSLHDAGFRIVATRGTAEAISRMGVPVERLNKIGEGSPHVVDWIERGDVDLVINTPTGVGARTDGHEIRRAAVTHGVPCLTTLSAGMSAARAISRGRIDGEPEVICLQDLHGIGRAANGGAASGPDGGAGARVIRGRRADADPEPAANAEAGDGAHPGAGVA
jgi:carbamoyl-phosphate synthase large subunit